MRAAPRIEVAHARQESAAAHPGHPHIRDDHVGRCERELVEGRVGSPREHHFPLALLPLQQVAQVGEDLGVVVDEQDADHGRFEQSAGVQKA